MLFDVASYADYGKLSGRSTDEMIAGARVEVAPYKKSPADFVLWKPSTPDLPGWDSPWGRGRPGWHIECSAMAEAHLGETIDIHAGGNDLMFPHHENEIAQSTCAHGGRLFARYWLHNGMLTFNGRKMSKSLGNVMLLHELLQKHPPELLRYLLIKAHYRQPLDWSDSTIAQARATLDGWYGALRDLADVEIDTSAIQTPAEIEAALLDDLNTPQALAAISELAASTRRAATMEQKKAAKSALLGAGGMLGLLRQDPETWFKQGLGFAQGTSSSATNAAPDPKEIDDLVEQRNAARKAKNFAEADRIRDLLASKGIAIEDGAQGTRWKVVNPNECAA